MDSGGGGGGGGHGSSGGGGGMVQMGRVSHPPKIERGGPTSTGSTVPPLTSSLPPLKPTSSYQTGTKFHSSHATSTAVETQFSTTSHNAKGSQENDAQTLDTTVQQFPRHRIHRRTKEQDAPSKANISPLPSIRETAPASNVQYNRSIVQFDLEASAFPPLPGLDADIAKSHNATTEIVTADSLQSQNRLSDVVKGTAKLKGTKDKEQHAIGGTTGHSTQQQQQTSTSSRSTSPGSSSAGHANAGGNQEQTIGVTSIASNAAQSAASTASSNIPVVSKTDSDIALSTVILTPPSSPDK